MAALLYQRILEALEGAGVRYVVVGGFAVNLHGFVRFTKDLDVLVDLDPVNARLAMEVLGGTGLKPRAPVPLSAFADTEVRQDWAENKHMLVFQLWHPDDPFCTVDVFIRNPIAFDGLWTRSMVTRLGSVPCRIASLDDLIAMKQMAGRPQDLRDILELQRLRQLDQELGA